LRHNNILYNQKGTKGNKPF